MRTVVCVLVHHSSLDTLQESIKSLLTAPEIAASSMLIVDNSPHETAVEVDAIASAWGIEVLHVSNEGFANAVNLGISHWFERLQRCQYVLVATHEVRLASAHSIATLVATANDDVTVAAVGPCLKRHGSEDVWSLGGRIERFTGRPRHFTSRQADDPEIVDVTWLDGAFVLYRTAAIRTTRMPELYFLYYEEVDFHLQLSRMGWRIQNDRRSVVFQQTSGTPAYYLARNLVLFLARNGRLGQWLYSPPICMIYAILSGPPAGGRRFERATTVVRGLVDGYIAVWQSRRERRTSMIREGLQNGSATRGAEHIRTDDT